MNVQGGDFSVAISLESSTPGPSLEVALGQRQTVSTSPRMSLIPVNERRNTPGLPPKRLRKRLLGAFVLRALLTGGSGAAEGPCQLSVKTASFPAVSEDAIVRFELSGEFV